MFSNLKKIIAMMIETSNEVPANNKDEENMKDGYIAGLFSVLDVVETEEDFIKTDYSLEALEEVLEFVKDEVSYEDALWLINKIYETEDDIDG